MAITLCRSTLVSSAILRSATGRGGTISVAVSFLFREVVFRPLLPLLLLPGFFLSVVVLWLFGITLLVLAVAVVVEVLCFPVVFGLT